MRVTKNPIRLRKMERIPSLADRKRMLIEVIELCDNSQTIGELEAVMIQAAARALAE